MARCAVACRGGRRPVRAPKAYLSLSAVILGTGMSQNGSRARRHTLFEWVLLATRFLRGGFCMAKKKIFYPDMGTVMFWLIAIEAVLVIIFLAPI